MKMIYDHVRPDKNLNPQTKEIIRIHSAWISASTPYNVTQACRKAGFVEKLLMVLLSSPLKEKKQQKFGIGYMRKQNHIFRNKEKQKT